MFKKAKRPIRIYEDVASQIEEAILDGQLEVGQRLPSERTLAEVFEVSRRTLREALRIVESKGLIAIRNTGITVRVKTMDKVSQSLSLALRTHQISWKDIAQVRAELDANIAGHAAREARPKDIAVLEAIFTQASELSSMEKPPWTDYFKLDRKFHLVLAKITGNPVYELLLLPFLDNLEKYYEAYLPKATAFCADNTANIGATVEAIKKHDTAAARRAAAEHLEIGTKYGAV